MIPGEEEENPHYPTAAARAQSARLHFLIELSQEMSKDVLANDSDISLLSYLHSERQFSRA